MRLVGLALQVHVNPAQARDTLSMERNAIALVASRLIRRTVGPYRGTSFIRNSPPP
jgi:hypothetical protein